METRVPEAATINQLFVNVDAELERQGILQCSERSPVLELQIVNSTAHPRWKVCHLISPVSTYCISPLPSLRTHQNMNLEMLDPPCYEANSEVLLLFSKTTNQWLSNNGNALYLKSCIIYFILVIGTYPHNELQQYESKVININFLWVFKPEKQKIFELSSCRNKHIYGIS